MKNYLRFFVKATSYVIIIGCFLISCFYFVSRGTSNYFNIEITDVLVAQLLSTCSLMFSGLLSQQYTVENNRLHDYHEILTKETRANNLYVRNNVVNLLTLSSPSVIISLKDDKDYVRKIVDCKHKLLAHFKIIVPQEVELINCIDELCKHSIQYYYGSSDKDCEQLCLLGKKLYYLFSLYDYSDWRYIKAHVRNFSIQDISDWEVIYKEQKVVFENEKNKLKSIQW